jgi:IclR family transcriptional regulator, acetate operon repressor
MDVKSSGRTVDLFEVFARRQVPLTVSDIARGIKAPLTSCFYLVRALEERGYLYTLNARREIYPTRKLLDAAQSIKEGEPRLARLEPMLVALRDSTGETVIVATRQDNRVIYLAVIEGQQTIRYTARVGDFKPLHSSSAGKVLLSALEPNDRAKIVAKLQLHAVTSGTITDRATLMADLERSAKRGYAETRGENVPDVMAIARSVQIDGDIYAIVVAGPTHRMTKQVGQHLNFLGNACAKIAELT